MEVVRTEYFAVDVCGWKPNCSSMLEVAALCMAQLPMVCLTSSLDISGDLPWSCYGVSPGHRGSGTSCTWGLGSSRGHRAGYPKLQWVLLPNLVSWAWWQRQALALLTELWEASAVRRDVLWLKGLEAWGTLSLPCGDSCFVALPWPCGWEGGRCCFEIRIGGRTGPRTASRCRPL